jgi:hypothetical protein
MDDTIYHTVALLFVFDKHCLIIDQLDSKDSCRKLQANCVISYYFYLYLMFHVCTARFDVMGNLKFFTIFFELNKA